MTNASGEYSVSNLDVATYSLQVSASGYGLGNQSGITVSAGQTSVVNFSLSGQGAIIYTYDALGRLIGVTDPTNGTAEYSYDAVGNIMSVSRISAGQVSILDFTPKSGSAGMSVAISGTAFSTNPSQNSVTFNGISATVTSASANQLVVTVPAGAITGPLSVTSPSGTATSSASFSVTSSSVVLPFISHSLLMAQLKITPSIAGSGSRRRPALMSLSASPTRAFSLALLDQDTSGAGPGLTLQGVLRTRTDSADASMWNIEMLRESETNQ